MAGAGVPAGRCVGCPEPRRLQAAVLHSSMILWESRGIPAINARVISGNLGRGVQQRIKRGTAGADLVADIHAGGLCQADPAGALDAALQQQCLHGGLPAPQHRHEQIPCRREQSSLSTVSTEPPGLAAGEPDRCMQLGEGSVRNLAERRRITRQGSRRSLDLASRGAGGGGGGGRGRTRGPAADLSHLTAAPAWTRAP